MTVPPPFTARHNSPQSSARQNVGRGGLTVHHAATTNFTWLRDVTLGRVGGRTVSYTAIVRNDLCELIVSNNLRRPWSVGNAYWDSRNRSVCIANSASGGSWPVSPDSMWTTAWAIAYWSEREGWWPHRSGAPRTWTVIGHGELRPIHGASQATACPGGADLGLITRWAQQMRRESVNPPPPPAPPPPPPLEEETMPIFGHRSEGADEWILIDPDGREDDELQIGYRVTTDLATAQQWARVYRNGWVEPLVGERGRYQFSVNRADYIRIQEQARLAYAARSRALIERVHDVTPIVYEAGSDPGPEPDPEDLVPSGGDADYNVDESGEG